MRTQPSPLEEQRMPVRAQLASAWTAFMFLYIYVDYYHLYKPGTLDLILEGRVFEFAVSPVLLTAFLALSGIPALMVALSATLPARANRTTQLVVASMYIPVTVFNAVGESWEWAPFYVLSIGVELVLLAFILRSAWTWPRTATSAAQPSVRVADHAPQQA
ncbi:DUF6326 family protein [Microbacterium hydrocarbonoxydans]|uniref:DUF6326 family protein n=1 Tax=Microbacterium hydrocarbonoxydans TaxID=273678 RepID=UPI0013DBFCAA|nr:DUF6326 family protein [Microbacterium hydrocarbonoxydans]